MTFLHVGGVSPPTGAGTPRSDAEVETPPWNAPAHSGSATVRGLTEGGSMAEFTTGTQTWASERAEVRVPAAGGTAVPATARTGERAQAGETGPRDGHETRSHQEAEARELQGVEARVETPLLEGSGVRAETPLLHGPAPRSEARPLHGSEVRVELPPLPGPEVRTETPSLHGPDPCPETTPLHVPAPRPEDPPLHGPAPRSETSPLDGHEAGVILERVRASVDPELRSALESLPGSLRRVALYHFGWEHADGTPAAGNAGKAIRPALVLTAATALGGDRARAAAVRAAVAVELVHNFTLLHDDVMDRDTTRRHRPTAWTVFGDADAILAGDALQALALRLLAEDPHPAAGMAAARLADCVVELCEGQHEDTAMEALDPGEVTLDQVLVMAEAKTGALLGCACALGALYAGASGEEVGAMDAFGREAGLAFQLIDDVIGIWGDPSRTGKPAGADLAARKKSLPVVAALTSGTAAAAELAALYSAPYDEGDLARTALAVEEAGGRDWAQVQAADRMARAMGQLARAVPDPEAAGGLLSLAEFVTRRSA